MSVTLLTSLKLVCVWTNSRMSSLTVDFSGVWAWWDAVWDASQGAAGAGPSNPAAAWLLSKTLFLLLFWGYFKETETQPLYASVGPWNKAQMYLQPLELVGGIKGRSCTLARRLGLLMIALHLQMSCCWGWTRRSGSSWGLFFPLPGHRHGNAANNFFWALSSADWG